MTQGQCVVAVVVTWNRCALLAESLRAILGQTPPPARVVVVDNASTDGTADLLAQGFADVEVVRLRRNSGGAGGFAAGIDRALHGRCDALWLMDDDTIPEPTALDALVSARERYGGHPPALVASRVVWTDGRSHPMNTPRPKPGVRRGEYRAAAAVDCAPIRSASFVSILIDAETARRRGLPVAEYFLWNDDFEYTTRLLRGLPGLYCPASVAVHKTATFGSTDVDPGDRFFFEVRNKVWMFTRSSSLSPWEKVVYGGSTLRRWVKTFHASADRATLWRCLRTGAYAGLRRGPRSTVELLDEISPVQSSDGLQGTDG